MKLSIILSTRGRPHLLVPTVRTTLKNVTNKETVLTVMIDADDTATIQTIPQLQKMGAKCHVTARPMSLGGKYNQGARAEPGDVYLVMVDYAPHVTPGFDDKILEAAATYSDGYAVVYNWWANLSFPGINAVTHKLFEKMGGIYPELYPYWWVDHALDDIARMIDRVVFAPVEIDVSARKDTQGKPWTQGKRDTWFWALLFDVESKERKRLAAEIISSDDFEDTADRKKAMLQNFSWIEHHTVLVNSHARQDAGVKLPPDPWYDEVFENGLKKFKEILSDQQFAELEKVMQQQKAA
jgi:hypothetical protein